MEQFYRRALQNVVRHGDTDIFPFPIENHVLHDRPDDVVALLARLDVDVRQSLAQEPPFNVGALAPVGYTGFRWATQIDPIWNVAYLSWVLSIADQIEAARQPISRDRVFSYRYSWSDAEAFCFNKAVNWRSFVAKAIEKAQTRAFVVSCDISEFYLRINHHRIENAIRHLPGSDYAYPRIKSFLSHLSNTYSFGLPVGGPASRLISELVLSQIDTLLLSNGIDFVRYADDFYLFADSPDQCFKALVTLTRLLIENQGLQLQKSKTRIMSAAEFLSSNPLVHDSEEGGGAPLGASRQALMAINVYYDPYSPTASEDYQTLKGELDKYPVMEIIRAELKKSRVDVTLSRRLVSLARYLDGPVLDEAFRTLIEADEILYPLYYNVLISTKEVFDRLTEETQVGILQHVIELIENSSRVMAVDLNLQYAVRLLSLRDQERSRTLLYNLYRSDHNEGVKRDVLLTLARWGDWHWLSDVKNRFRALSDVSKRSFIVASFGLSDEGDHWRKSVKREMSGFEELVRTWAQEKSSMPHWRIPL